MKTNSSPPESLKMSNKRNPVCQVLYPPLSDLPPEPPTLVAFLNSSSSFTLFRQYALVRYLFICHVLVSKSHFYVIVLNYFNICVCVILKLLNCVFSQMYNLSGNLSTSDFTVLLPTDDAIRQYLSRTNSSILVGPDYIARLFGL